MVGLNVWSVIGRPGVDAGLYSRLLAARLRAQLVAVPEIAAYEVAQRTHVGSQLSVLDGSRGALLPSPLVSMLVQTPLHRAVQTAADGRTSPALLLAGFPRTCDQVRMLQIAGVPPPSVLFLDTSREEAERRLAHRHVCAACGEPMHTVPTKESAATRPPVWVHMIDESDCDQFVPVRAAVDAPAAVRRRLDEFEAHTLPVLEALRAGGASGVVDVAVAARVEDTWASVEAAVGLEPLASTLQNQETTPTSPAY